jgi:hypothetical protein
MEKTPEFLKNRILWRAKHFKLTPDFTFLFEQLASSQKNAFSNLAENSGLGKPVIYFTKDINQWTLVCTNGIVSCYNDKSSKICYTDIKSMRPEFLDSIPEGMPIDISKTKKSEWNELIIYDKSDNKHCLATKTGQDHFALMNIILMMRKLMGW